jgi:hypothetical protein
VRPALLVFAGVIWIPLATTVLVNGSVWPAVRAMTVPVVRLLDVVAVVYSFGAIGLGLVSLFLNCRSQVESGARRKARLAALLPGSTVIASLPPCASGSRACPPRAAPIEEIDGPKRQRVSGRARGCGARETNAPRVRILQLSDLACAGTSHSRQSAGRIAEPLLTSSGKVGT